MTSRFPFSEPQPEGLELKSLAVKSTVSEQPKMPGNWPEFKRIQAKVLSIWAGANLVGGDFYLLSHQDTLDHFQLLATIWQGLNLFIGSYMWFKAVQLTMAMRGRRVASHSLFPFVNNGLDLFYWIEGLYIVQHTIAQTEFISVETGLVVLVQGCILLLLDISSILRFRLL